MTAPEPGWTTEVDYIRPVDADTIEVEIRRRFNVRLKDIDAPERWTLLGKEAIEFVDQELCNAERIIVRIPTNNPIKLMDMNSFERVVGEIFVDNDNLSELLKAHGYEKTR